MRTGRENLKEFSLKEHNTLRVSSPKSDPSLVSTRATTYVSADKSMVVTDSEDFPYTSRGMFTPNTRRGERKRSERKNYKKADVKKGRFLPSREVKKSLLKFVVKVIH